MMLFICYKRGCHPRDGAKFEAFSELDARRQMSIAWDLPIEQVLCIKQGQRTR